MAAQGMLENSPVLKHLAGSNPVARQDALDSFRTYLSGRATLSETEALKLWKGLFYCMWMSDGAANQRQLASDLAALLWVLPAGSALQFLDAFWRTMAREWAGIDALRMDKYLYLVRRCLGESFRYIARDWRAVGDYMAVLSKTAFNTDDQRVPNGLRYHVLDIYVDELEKMDDKAGMPVDELFAPIKLLAEKSPTKAVRMRAKETLGDERLEDWRSGAVNAAVD